MVREERLELSRLAALEPKSSASTNSATPALCSQFLESLLSSVLHFPSFSTFGRKWLGYQDLNLRMTGSKPAALPLGYTPKAGCIRR